MVSELVRISNMYGNMDGYVLAGGGNTSLKEGNTLYVKASGTTLKTITAEGFVKMDRAKLDSMTSKTYSENEAEREKEVLADLLAAKMPGEESKRPSVETSLHELMPQKYIVHLHPTLVNGLTCSKNGEKTAERLFGKTAVWVPAVEPGWVLSLTVKEYLDRYKSSSGKDAEVVFLANHGVFVAADTTERIRELYSDIMTKLKAEIKRVPDFSPASFDTDKAVYIAPCVRMLLKQGETSVLRFETNTEIMSFVESREAFEPVAHAYTPDHMVYCSSHFLFVPAKDDMKEQYSEIKSKISEYKEKYNTNPKIVAVEKLGVYAHGDTKKNADITMSLFFDNLKIAVYASNISEPELPPKKLVDFIDGWEVEKYRRTVALKSDRKRISEKITIVTGAAQGFGEGIADSMMVQGANMVIADLNYDLAQKTAADKCEKYGENRAVAVKTDVSDENSVKEMIAKAVLEFGGLDIFVNNAGIAKPGSLEEMGQGLFETITKVNYTAYFLCAKHAARIMKIQNEFAPDYYMDIVQVNSKSGLVGSNKNFAYAGSKFGGIGLTQSFALELVDYNIKVNSVCPGNFFDGPLWSDPVKGLFVQYLNAGKVPGAKTIADVKKYYESKIPMNRGCLPVDVAKAIIYCTEQCYETGQAIPVTGGQVMLS